MPSSYGHHQESTYDYHQEEELRKRLYLIERSLLGIRALPYQPELAHALAGQASALALLAAAYVATHDPMNPSVAPVDPLMRQAYALKAAADRLDDADFGEPTMVRQLAHDALEQLATFRLLLPEHQHR